MSICITFSRGDSDPQVLELSAEETDRFVVAMGLTALESEADLLRIIIEDWLDEWDRAGRPDPAIRSTKIRPCVSPRHGGAD